MACFIKFCLTSRSIYSKIINQKGIDFSVNSDPQTLVEDDSISVHFQRTRPLSVYSLKLDNDKKHLDTLTWRIASARVHQSCLEVAGSDILAYTEPITNIVDNFNKFLSAHYIVSNY